tara:strand:- start:17993 stop:19024 length:1032 start_codon:yes stop_codon:yes gene_type:complete
LGKKAIITGITGQDGAYLCQYLLEKNYEVIGCYRRSSTLNLWRLKELKLLAHPNVTLEENDVTDSNGMVVLLNKFEPTEIYNLAAQSFVTSSFSNPSATSQINAIGTLNILEAIRLVNPSIKFYQASTSEMYGKVQADMQNEKTPFYPRSPYAVSKLYAHWITVNYRESYNIFGAAGILFNHESPLRGEEFVTRKISKAVSGIKLNMQKKLILGNLDAKRDWGYAKDYVVGMWKMLQAKEPKSYVLATGKNETIRNFAKLAFRAAGMDIEFFGAKDKEYAINKRTGEIVLEVSSQFYRPAEVDSLLGDASLARADLNWEPKTNLEDLAKMMVERDIERLTLQR